MHIIENSVLISYIIINNRKARSAKTDGKAVMNVFGYVDTETYLKAY